MIIYNKTNQVQELRVYDRNTKRPYSIYVCSKSSTEITPDIHTPDLEKLVKSGVFQIVGTPAPVLPEIVETTPKESLGVSTHLEEEVIADVVVVESQEENIPEEAVVEESEEIPEDLTKFICEVCGGEFASARGLANHMKRSH